MKRNNTLIRPFQILLLAGLLFAAGCVERDLDDRPTTGTLELALQWPDGIAPKGAKMYLYDTAGKLVRQADCKAQGHTMKLDAGEYRLIIHNSDATGVGYAGTETHGAAQAYALNLSGREPKAGEELAEPHNLYSIGRHAKSETFSIGSNQTTRITAAPVARTKTVGFLFSVSGIDDIASFTGTLKGVSPSVTLCTGEYGQTSCLLPFTTKPYTEQKSAVSGTKATGTPNYAASMELFDLLTKAGSAAETNTIGFTVKDSAGNTYASETDITEALQKIISDNKGTLPVRIALNIALEINPVTAEISATVSPWEEADFDWEI